jgi:hypothetical protein
LDVNGNSTSSDYQTNVISYNYSGSSNQRWVFEQATTGVGVAWTFNSKNNGHETNSPNINCYLYALGVSNPPHPGTRDDDLADNGGGTDAWVDTMTNRVLTHVRSKGRRIDVIPSATTAIPSNRYRFCMRISATDYHFWVQSSDRGWVDKQGWYYAATIKGYVNPTTASWGSYNSRVVYFASTYN